MQSQLKKVLAKSNSKVVAAIPIGSFSGALVFTDDGRVFRLSGLVSDSYVATEQTINMYTTRGYNS